VRIAEFLLADQALGTSGSGTQFFHYQGKRYGHIIDPRTGWPAEQVLSATVIARTAEQADALSTAFYVLGPAGAGTYCEQHPEVAALLVTASGRAGGVGLHAINLHEDRWRRLM
jgi:thiamine biosynthesis lipoprotein